MIDRLLLTLVLVGLILLAYRSYSRAILRRRASNGLGLERWVPGKPGVLYFTDPGCAPCVHIQDPALRELAVAFGERLQIVKVQALERHDLTEAWGVLSLPTTFIIDAEGQPRGVNHGVARSHKLLGQLAAINEYPARPDRSGELPASKIDPQPNQTPDGGD